MTDFQSSLSKSAINTADISASALVLSLALVYTKPPIPNSNPVDFPRSVVYWVLAEVLNSRIHPENEQTCPASRA